MKHKILIIGGGIGGLTSAIALRKKGFDVDVIEKDPEWSVYGVGIIQQANVVRAVHQLGILEDYLDAGFGFNHVDMFAPNGAHVAKVPAPKLTEGFPASVGIGRPALHKVLGDRTIALGATVRLGITATKLDDTGDAVHVTFSDGSAASYDLVIGADGLYSTTREIIFPDAPKPRFTGQGVWRYNFPRPDDVDGLHAYSGEKGVGLVPLSKELIYMYLTTAEPGNPRYDRKGIAAIMRDKMEGTASTLQKYRNQITEDDGVVYKPLEALFIYGDWHKGRIVLIGDAVHATTPHLGQGAGMAIEDSLVLAEELTKNDELETIFTAFRARRFERCKFISESSIAVGDWQLGKGPAIDYAQLTHEMFEVTAQPI